MLPGLVSGFSAAGDACSATFVQALSIRVDISTANVIARCTRLLIMTVPNNRRTIESDGGPWLIMIPETTY